MFQFYGANRTGRWAGRIIQMQNLPQNHLDDLSEARGLVRVGDFDALEMLYEDVPEDVYKRQLISIAFFFPRNASSTEYVPFAATSGSLLKSANRL